MNPKQAVELFHLLFLNFLGQKLDKKLYALKGGCNMRFYLKSIRYSEDIDIDIKTISKDTLKNKIEQILESSSFKNVLKTRQLEILDWSDPKQTETTQRWKVALKTPRSTLATPTRIEFSRRKVVDEETLFEPIDANILRLHSLPMIMATHYSINSMFEQKILALALRNQVQARDVFDLYLLITTQNNLVCHNKETIVHIPQAIAQAFSISFMDFKGQVVAYLPEDFIAQYDDKDVWDNIVLTVTKSLEANLCD